MASNTTHTIDHPILGKLCGRVSDDGKTIQYRNIKFANISGRWQDPDLYSGSLSTNGSVFDATKFGPSCPQLAAAYFKFDLGLVGDLELELSDAAKEMDEFHCLNLVITVPNFSADERLKQEEEGNKRLPVMVWVHGGGLFSGGNSWPQYATQLTQLLYLSNLVRTSAEIGKPVIGVSINYRLGILGFLASDELGVRGNYGLKDQECAFKWTKQHIEGFGGNPTRVTAFGESAGSISLSTLLHTSPSTPLFESVILMSGDPTLRRPRDMTWLNSQYQAIASHLFLTESSLQSRVDFFRNTPADELINKIPPAGHWSAAIDGVFIGYDITVGILCDPTDDRGKPDWCERILVGDAEHDATCLHARVMALPPTKLMERLHGGLEATLSVSQSEKVLKDYSLPSMHKTSTDQPAEPHSQFYNSILELASDLRFHLPKVKLAEGFVNHAPAGTDSRKMKTRKTKCWRYEYHQPNPIPKTQFSNYAGHEQELAFLLQNFPALSSFSRSENSPSPEIQKKTAKFGKDMAAAWIRFAHGEAVQGLEDRGEQEEVSDKLLVMGPNYEFKFMTKDEYNREYRKGRVENLWGQIPWQAWFDLGEKLQGC